jgi:TATA-binding protein-associated factor Taf7
LYERGRADCLRVRAKPFEKKSNSIKFERLEKSLSMLAQKDHLVAGLLDVARS